MSSRYAAAHASPAGPGDARPTAYAIIKDEGLEGKLLDKVVLITGCSSGIGVIQQAIAGYRRGTWLLTSFRHRYCQSNCCYWCEGLLYSARYKEGRGCIDRCFETRTS